MLAARYGRALALDADDADTRAAFDEALEFGGHADGPLAAEVYGNAGIGSPALRRWSTPHGCTSI